MRISKPVSPLLAVVLASAGLPPSVVGAPRGDGALRAVMIRLRDEVLAFRDEVERAYDDRCSSGTLNTCQENNYDACSSLYPDQTCPSADFAVISQCGKGERCNGLFDWTVSTVRLPRALADGPDGNPTDPDVIETVCYSRLTDNFQRKVLETDGAFWAKNGIPYPPGMYYGAMNGAFRIYPARQSDTCGAYDPRLRPWYIKSVPQHISESVGGRDVVLVIDHSKSVGLSGHLKMFQGASEVIVNRLTEYDRVAVVFFNEDAEVAGGYTTLVTATEEIKQALKKAINEVKPLGRTNYQAGFQAAFSVLKESEVPADGPNCNAAILFFTDKEMNYPYGATAEDVIDLVNGEMETFADANRTHIFTYSAEDNMQMKEISCGTDSIWHPTTNSTSVTPVDLVDNYFQFNALSLGDDANKNFTTWEGPYTFSTGGIKGITSSALVYDRRTAPALFLGAVGSDLNMEQVEKILGYGGDRAEITVKEIMENLTDTPITECPLRLPSPCGLEAARYYSGEDLAVCNKTCLNNSAVMPAVCSGQDEYPDDLWNNTKLMDMTYEDRVCCRVGQSATSSDCPKVDLYGEPKLTNMQIFGIILGAILGCEIIACVYWFTGCKFLRREKKSALRT